MTKSNWSGLQKLKDKVKKLEQPRSIPLNELFNTSFMNSFTKYSNINDFFEDGDFDFTSNEDFEKIPEEKLNRHVKAYTSFSSWNEMKAKAGEIWMIKELDF